MIEIIVHWSCRVVLQCRTSRAFACLRSIPELAEERIVESRQAYQGNRNIGRIWKDELDFFELVASSPIFSEEYPLVDKLKVEWAERDCIVPSISSRQKVLAMLSSSQSCKVKHTNLRGRGQR